MLFGIRQDRFNLIGQLVHDLKLFEKSNPGKFLRIKRQFIGVSVLRLSHALDVFLDAGVQQFPVRIV